jgi:hypothetical protein
MKTQSLVIPEWLDQVQGVDFTPEKELLTDMEVWAGRNGWDVSDGSKLPSELKRRTDVFLDQPDRERHLRVAVLPTINKGPGMIRIDASSHRVFELVYQPRARGWRIETAAVPLTDPKPKVDWNVLIDLAFKP